MNAARLRQIYDGSVEGICEELRQCASEAWEGVKVVENGTPLRGLLGVVAVSWVHGEPMTLHIAVIPEDSEGGQGHAR